MYFAYVCNYVIGIMYGVVFANISLDTVASAIQGGESARVSQSMYDSGASFTGRPMVACM